jgi:hypothetical protein
MLNAASFRRMAALASLVATLATPWASATSLPSGEGRPVHLTESASPDLLGRVLGFLRMIRTKEGCKLDPNGRCSVHKAEPPHTKEGCKIDPDGRCLQ